MLWNDFAWGVGGNPTTSKAKAAIKLEIQIFHVYTIKMTEFLNWDTDACKPFL